jgi:plasmanylethanolamine desaturase
MPRRVGERTLYLRGGALGLLPNVDAILYWRVSENDPTYPRGLMRTCEHVEALAAGYMPAHRIYEWCGIVLASASALWLGVRLSLSADAFGGATWLAILACALAGILSADFVSGFFHWLFDTWGGVDTPVVGALAIRTFRHHHVDPDAMTQHDFVETNGHNCALSLVPFALGIWWSYAHPSSPELLVSYYFASFAFFVAFTSQIHKWAHVPQPPRLVRFLQRLRLLLAPTHHAQHHVAPHDCGYCVTVGWLNRPLRALRFFEALESAIRLCSRALPRRGEARPGYDDPVVRSQH